MSTHETAAPAAMEVLVFEVAQQRFAVPAAEVREVIRAVALSTVPAASGVDGVMNLRGRVVPVLDIRPRFRLPAKSVQHTDQFIVCQAGERLLAVRADRTVELRQVTAGDLEQAPDVLQSSGVIAAVAKVSDGLVLLLNPCQLFAPAESSALGELTGADQATETVS